MEHDYFRILRKRWLLITLLTLLGLVAALVYSLLKTPEYSSSAKVFVSTSGDATIADLQQGNTFTQARVKTYSELVTTPIVLLPVIADLGIDDTSDHLALSVTATAPLSTSLIEIEVTGEDPARTAELATSIAESLTEVVESIENTSSDAEGASPVRLTLVQKASVPQQPVSPNIPLNLVLGTLVGLILGIGVAMLVESLDTRVRNERDIKLITDRPILGGIPLDPKSSERPLIVHADPHSGRAEAFRTLRTNLQYLDAGRPERTFVVTSSVEAEGKSTTAANLAIALGDAGARVLLVDADLRRPSLAELMGIEGGAGLTDVLIGRAEKQDVIQGWGRTSVYLLPAGRVPPNPSELLGSVAMVSLVAELGRVFDVVLFDSPPLLPVTDAAVLARAVGGAIVVVGAGRVHRNQLKGALAALDDVGASVSGLVLTMLPTKGPDAYGYVRYGHETGYGYKDAPTPQPAASAVRASTAHASASRTRTVEQRTP